MKAQIYSAYVAGLCPLEVLMKYGPDSHGSIQQAAAFDEASADLPHEASRRKRALIFILTLGLTIGAWQLLSRIDGRQAADVSHQDSAAEPCGRCA